MPPKVRPKAKPLTSLQPTTSKPSRTTRSSNPRQARAGTSKPRAAPQQQQQERSPDEQLLEDYAASQSQSRSTVQPQTRRDEGEELEEQEEEISDTQKILAMAKAMTIKLKGEKRDTWMAEFRQTVEQELEAARRRGREGEEWKAKTEAFTTLLTSLLPPTLPTISSTNRHISLTLTQTEPSQLSQPSTQQQQQQQQLSYPPPPSLAFANKLLSQSHRLLKQYHKFNNAVIDASDTEPLGESWIEDFDKCERRIEAGWRKAGRAMGGLLDRNRGEYTDGWERGDKEDVEYEDVDEQDYERDYRKVNEEVSEDEMDIDRDSERVEEPENDKENRRVEQEAVISRRELGKKGDEPQGADNEGMSDVEDEEFFKLDRDKRLEGLKTVIERIKNLDGIIE